MHWAACLYSQEIALCLSEPAAHDHGLRPRLGVRLGRSRDPGSTLCCEFSGEQTAEVCFADTKGQVAVSFSIHCCKYCCGRRETLLYFPVPFGLRLQAPLQSIINAMSSHVTNAECSASFEDFLVKMDAKHQPQGTLGRSAGLTAAPSMCVTCPRDCVSIALATELRVGRVHADASRCCHC